jgi:hypothetical protein
MHNILNYLVLLNLIILTMCIAMFFIENGLQIHVSNFDLNISPFGLYVVYAIFTMFIIFINIYYIIQLKINRNKRAAKFAKFLEEFNKLKHRRANDVVLDLPSKKINKADPSDEATSSEPSITDAVQDANYEQLRLLFSN